MSILIQGRSLSSRKPLFADWSVPAPPRPDDGDDALTLRRLIEHVVRAEVRAFEERREARRLDRVLSPRAIADGQTRGKVAPGGRVGERPADVHSAIGAAWQAFEDGLYLVIIDGVEHRELDAQVFLNPDSRLTFVRLVFLAGA